MSEDAEPDEGFEVEWRRDRPAPARRQALELEGAELDARAESSPAARLQRRLGNAGVTQLRSRLQRRTFSGAETPQWMKDEVGITAESEANAARAERVEDAADGLSFSSSGGTPLARELREGAERDLGVSLGGVRVVHDDAAARSVEALAFASGSDVVLSRQVDLDTRDGQFTLAHELAHVAQQQRGQADALDGLGGDPSLRASLEQDADASAARILRQLDEPA
jgi:Domain of unknown function (DUF4157)